MPGWSWSNRARRSATSTAGEEIEATAPTARCPRLRPASSAALARGSARADHRAVSDRVETGRAAGRRPGVVGPRGAARGLRPVLAFLAVESAAVSSLGTPLLPTVQRVDHVSLAASQWTLTITLLVGAVATPLLGRLADTRARRATTLGALTTVLAGCVLSALPAGFAVFLAGRALQGAGLGLVPLATAQAADGLAGDGRRRTIVLIGIMTAAGIGIGYPLVGLSADYLGLGAPFWLVAALSAVALAAAAFVLPPSPRRGVRVDVGGAVLLGAGIAGLLLTLAQGPGWGWSSAATVACGVGGAALVCVFCWQELRVGRPLVELRLLRARPVLAANVTAFLVAVGFYPLMSLVVRFVQTPASAGYGFGASVVVAGLMLTPFSAASFAASRLVSSLARRVPPEWMVAAGCVPLIASMVVFGAARGGYGEIVAAMLLSGAGVGCVYAVNPLQITGGVPASETGSAMSFYQLVRTSGYSIASALAATLLVAGGPHHQAVPPSSAYGDAAHVSVGVLAGALGASALFALTRPGRRGRPAGPDGSGRRRRW